MQLLWTYAKKSVALRVQYFLTQPKGGPSHSVLVQDIPGVPFGTQANRVESVAPKFIATKVCSICRLCCLLMPGKHRGLKGSRDPRGSL